MGEYCILLKKKNQSRESVYSMQGFFSSPQAVV